MDAIQDTETENDPRLELMHKTDALMLDLLDQMEDHEAVFIVSKFVHDHDTEDSPWVNAWMKEHADWKPTMLDLHRQGRRIRLARRIGGALHPWHILKRLVPLTLLLFAARALGLL